MNLAAKLRKNNGIFPKIIFHHHQPHPPAPAIVLTDTCFAMQSGDLQPPRCRTHLEWLLHPPVRYLSTPHNLIPIGGVISGVEKELKNYFVRELIAFLPPSEQSRKSALFSRRNHPQTPEIHTKNIFNKT
ncbi:MAG: hypothetical protein IJU19_07330 [Bacteroidales bacterium]|nr:hypothetical protein [Bacteroidales bacterium]